MEQGGKGAERKKKEEAESPTLHSLTLRNGGEKKRELKGRSRKKKGEGLAEKKTIFQKGKGEGSMGGRKTRMSLLLNFLADRKNEMDRQEQGKKALPAPIRGSETKKKRRGGTPWKGAT